MSTFMLFCGLIYLSIAMGLHVSPIVPTNSFRLQASSPDFFGFLTQNKGKRVSAKIPEKKQSLEELLNKVQPNGVPATQEQRKAIDLACKELEALNPTKSPANSDKMTGFWRLRYSDFAEKGSSGGKLGPFIADVYQDLDFKRGYIVNSLKLGFPPIRGGLKAKQIVKDANTWQIEFEKAANDIAGIRFQNKSFPPGEFIRLWKITYLDDDFRILRARRPETKEEDAYIFVLRRDEASRFNVNFN